jgi:hypothetical protein
MPKTSPIPRPNTTKPKRYYPPKKDAVLYVPTPETKAMLDKAENKTALITAALLAYDKQKSPA